LLLLLVVVVVVVLVVDKRSLHAVSELLLLR